MQGGDIPVLPGNSSNGYGQDTDTDGFNGYGQDADIKKLGLLTIKDL